MKKSGLICLGVYAMAGALGALLFWASQNVQGQEDRLHIITAEQARLSESIRVLETEWAFLTAPERVDEIARSALGMESADVAMIAADAARLPEPAPVESEETNGVDVAAAERSPVRVAENTAPPRPAARPFPAAALKAPAPAPAATPSQPAEASAFDQPYNKYDFDRLLASLETAGTP